MKQKIKRENYGYNFFLKLSMSNFGNFNKNSGVKDFKKRT